MIGNEIIDIPPQPERWDQIDFGFSYVPKDPNEPRGLVLFDGTCIDHPMGLESEKSTEDRGSVDVETVPSYEVTLENYSEKMPVGVFKMEAGLMSQAGYVYEQMQKTRKTSAKLDGYLLDNDKIERLTPLERIELYKAINKNLEIGSQYLLDLHNTLQKTHENLNSVERMKSYTLKKPTSFEDKSIKREVSAVILEEIKRQVNEERNLNK